MVRENSASSEAEFVIRPDGKNVYSSQEDIMFRPRKPLIQPNVTAVPHGPGVYIIYDGHGRPFYVGRSRVSIHDRLRCHAGRTGSKKVCDALRCGEKLTFEWAEMLSPEQAESQLIDALGVVTAGNLRRETDPADW